MKRSSTLTLALGLVACCLAMRADSYTFSTIDVPGSYETDAAGINNAGQIVGSFFSGQPSPSGQPLHGFLYNNGAFTILDPPGSDLTVASAINNVGQIVGNYYTGTTSGVRYTFLYTQGGGFTTIETPDYLYPFSPTGINDAGTILGDCGFGGCTYSNGAFQGILLATGADYSNVESINNAGQVLIDAGYTAYNIDGFPIDYTDSFLATNGVLTQIQVPGATSTFATAVNNEGQIAGTYEIFGVCPFCGFFVDTDGVFTTFNFPGATDYTFGANVGGINDDGQIVGTYSFVDGPTLGFLATPNLATAAPEPDSLFLYCCGLVVAGIAIRRKRRSWLPLA
jgi:uncharacterized membrane protein